MVSLIISLERWCPIVWIAFYFLNGIETERNHLSEFYWRNSEFLAHVPKKYYFFQDVLTSSAKMFRILYLQNIHSYNCYFDTINTMQQFFFSCANCWEHSLSDFDIKLMSWQHSLYRTKTHAEVLLWLVG